VPKSESDLKMDPVSVGHFATTRWSQVIAAGQSQTPESKQALGTLCQNYWPPLYFFLRRQGHGVEDAEDLIQSFFLRLLERKTFKGLDRERGKFRSFLLAALKNHASDERDKAHAQKRGGGEKTLSLDLEFAEKRYLLAPSQELTPDKLFDRHWAETLIDRAFARLREEYAERGKERLFENLKDVLAGDDNRPGHREIARELDMTVGAVGVALYRMRGRYANALREEIAQTLARSEDVDEEIRGLFGVFE
jgi:RNA polymerase sigma factor (sigma-70 family)